MQKFLRKAPLHIDVQRQQEAEEWEGLQEHAPERVDAPEETKQTPKTVGYL